MLAYIIIGRTKRLMLLLLSMVIFFLSPVFFANCPNPTTNKPADSTQTDTKASFIIIFDLETAEVLNIFNITNYYIIK